MAYFVIDTFAQGLDRRRPRVGARPGSLWIGENVHISRGGTIQVRKSFAPKYSLPAGRTFGFARAQGLLYVFGSVDPSNFTGPASLPAGINYQRLQHPTGAGMTGVLCTTIFDGKIYAIATYDDDSTYHFYDGVEITDFADGKARGLFVINAGSHSAGVNKISSVKVNGVEVLGAAVDWTTSHSNTASLIATQINTYSSAYDAVASGPSVYVIAATPGTAYNDLTLQITTAGDVAASPTSTPLSGGLDDEITPGEVARTFKTKVYTQSGALALFTGVNNPATFNQSAIGAGAVNMSNHAVGGDTIKAIWEYLGFLAFFQSEAIQIWSIDADPEQNALVQIIAQLGLVAAPSVQGYGESDVAFLSARGIRSLRPSVNAANQAVTLPLSSPIDPLILEDLRTLSADVSSRAASAVEPTDGRLLMALGDKVYVLSSFAESSVNAWSVYNVGMQITEWVVAGPQLFARSGNVIYLYGGDDGATYDEDVTPIVEVVNIHMQAPATFKGLKGFDFGVDGEWEISLYHALDDTSTEEVAIVSTSTFDSPAIPVAAELTHLALRFEGRSSAREIVNIVVHFDEHEAD